MKESVLRDRRPAFERHTQTALLTLVVGLIAWTLSTVQDLSGFSAGMIVQVDGLQQQVSELKQQVGDLYPRSEAEKDNDDIRSDIRALGVRVRALEAAN